MGFPVVMGLLRSDPAVRGRPKNSHRRGPLWPNHTFGMVVEFSPDTSSYTIQTLQTVDRKYISHGTTQRAHALKELQSTPRKDSP